VVRLSKRDGTSINQFVATAVAEKVSALETARFFQGRKARADFKAFDKIMKRRGESHPAKGRKCRGSALMGEATYFQVFPGRGPHQPV